jgi:hypothetical protein
MWREMMRGSKDAFGEAEVDNSSVKYVMEGKVVSLLRTRLGWTKDRDNHGTKRRDLESLVASSSGPPIPVVHFRLPTDA